MVSRIYCRPNYLRNYLVRNLFNDTYSPVYTTNNVVNQRQPAVNISEHDENFLLELAVPGISKKELNISVDGNTLRIESNLDEGNKENFGKLFTGTFKKEYLLPENVNKDNIKASFKNGILSVHIPKEIPQKSPAIDVKIS